MGGREERADVGGVDRRRLDRDQHLTNRGARSHQAQQMGPIAGPQPRVQARQSSWGYIRPPNHQSLVCTSSTLEIAIRGLTPFEPPAITGAHLSERGAENKTESTDYRDLSSMFRRILTARDGNRMLPYWGAGAGGQCSDLLYELHRSHRWKVHSNHRNGVYTLAPSSIGDSGAFLCIPMIIGFKFEHCGLDLVLLEVRLGRERSLRHLDRINVSPRRQRHK